MCTMCMLRLACTKNAENISTSFSSRQNVVPCHIVEYTTAAIWDAGESLSARCKVPRTSTEKILNILRNKGSLKAVKETH